MHTPDSPEDHDAVMGQLAHEIRTPLTSILGYADLLVGDLRGMPGSLAKVHLIRRNGQALLKLTQDVVTFSQLQSDGPSPRPEPFSPASLAADVLNTMLTGAREKGLALEARLDTPLPERLTGDAGGLRQILINLVGNAVKFTAAGSVTLHLALDEVQTPAEADQPAARRPALRVKVADTGIGIASDRLEAIFAPFTQAEDSIAARFGGSGLGLSISRRLARRAGGRLSVESRVGHGSTFSVLYPVAEPSSRTLDRFPPDWRIEPAPPDRGADAPIAAALRGRRVLVVDDEPDSQLLLSVMLKHAGAAVSIAENGSVAEELAVQEQRHGKPFDVILMDMNMPGIDGYQTVRRLRAAGYARRIIALTAASMAEDRDRCLAAGCDEYANKPIDLPRLIEMMLMP